jgi:hypothetical protein
VSSSNNVIRIVSANSEYVLCAYLPCLSLLGTGRRPRRQRSAHRDVLLLPEDLPRLVTTPAGPGYPVHLVSALDRSLMPHADSGGTHNR